jgi:Spy/CpxP family protein refolding chaperone
MKTYALALSVAAAALLTIPSLTLAEDKPAGERPKRPEGGGRPGGPGAFSPEERIKRMTEELGLTQDQQDKLKAIFAKGETQFKALREKGRENLTEEDRTKMRDFFKAQTEEIGAVLTPEQKTKWQEAMEKRRQGRGPGGPGGERKPGEGRRPDAKPDAKPEAK